MTEVQYDDVEISYVKTHYLDCKPEMDPSGTDQLYSRFTYVCAGIVVAGPNKDGKHSEPAELIAEIRHKLTAPRKNLIIDVNGKRLVSVQGQMDDANGPKPLPGLTITRITDQSFAVTWGVEFCLRDCPENDKKHPLGPILSLRWMQTQDIDENNMSTFTISGRCIFSSTLLRELGADKLALTKADGWRDKIALTVPGVPQNCIRKSRYTLSADGLSIDFTFTDTEQYQMPPPDARKITGTFEKIISGGIVRAARVALRLEGKKNVPKRQLMAQCIATAMARLFAGAARDKICLLKEGAVREFLESNTVEVVLMAQVSDPREAFALPRANGFAVGLGQGLVTGVATFLNPALGGIALQQQLDALNDDKPGGNANKPVSIFQLGIGLEAFGVSLSDCQDPVFPTPGISPSLRGNYPGLVMAAAALRDPCLERSANPAKPIATILPLEPNIQPRIIPVSQPALAQPGATVNVVQTLPALEFKLQTVKEDKYGGIYTEYETTLTYLNDRGHREMMPATVADQPAKECRTHNDNIILRATWTAKKHGGTPTVPNWNVPTDENAVCTRVAISPETVELGADGVSPIFTITGTYDYGFKDSTKVAIHSPVPPWMNLPTRHLPSYPVDDTIIFGDGGRTSTLRSM